MTGLLKITLFAISVQATAQVPPPPVHPTPAPPLGVVITAPQGKVMPKRPKFMSTIQVAVHEPTFALQQRSQKLVIAEFKGVINSMPSLAGSPMHIRTSGNEVVLSIFMEKDQRVGMQRAVATLINHLNGVVPARGRSNYYRTNLSQPFSFLEVVLGEKPGTIRAISAQDIRLPDILAEIKQQFEERRARLEEKGEPPALMPLPGEKPQAPKAKKPLYESLSYFVIGGCTNGLVTWSFGEDSDQAEDIHESRRGAKQEKQHQHPRFGSEPVIKQDADANTDDQSRDQIGPDPHREPKTALFPSLLVSTRPPLGFPVFPSRAQTRIQVLQR